MILNVTGNREALSLRCVIELLKYNNGRVLLDIRGHHLAETQFGHITREHPDALERVFEDVDDYVHMLPVKLNSLHTTLTTLVKDYRKYNFFLIHCVSPCQR